MNKTALGVLALAVLALVARGVSGTMDKATDMVDGAVDIVKDGADAVADGAGDLAEGAVDIAKDGVDIVADGAEAVVDGAEDLGEGALDLAKDGADAAVDGATDIAQDGVEKVKDIVDGDDVAQDGTFAIKTEVSALLRKGATPLKSHNGDVQITSGEVTVTDGIISAGEFEIDMTTIDTIDLKEDEVDDMDTHLYGEDFFDVENFPKAMLVITDVTGNRVTADLTIKEKTHPVIFDVEVDGNKAMASFDIDRTKRDIMYNSPTLLEMAKDKAINDEIEFDVTLTR